MENLEPVLKKIFEEHPLASAEHSRPKGRTDSMRHEQKGRNRDEEQGGRDGCQSTGLSSIKTKGQEIKISHRPIVLAEELVLPSLSGLPMRLSINMSTLFSLRIKGIANYKNWSHFSLAGYVKPNALVAISVRAGVDGAFGRLGLEWVTQLKTFTSLDGAVYLHHGQSLKVVLNTPEDVMDVLTFNSRMYRVSGESKEELIATRNLKEKNTCTPKAWSKMVGWQLCSDIIYPLTLMGKGFPPLDPVLFTLRLQKLDTGLNQYLMEAAYTFVPQRNSWMPLEATLLLFLGTPQSIIPRDVSLDVNLSPKRLILKITHPLKTIHIQGFKTTSKMDFLMNISSSFCSAFFLQCTVKKEEETFNAHLSGTLPDDQEWRLSLSADIFNSIQDLAALPNSASLVGVLTQSKGLTEGELTVVVDDAVYGLEVTRQHDRKSGEDLRALLCLVAMEESLCVNINSNLTHCGCRHLHTQLSHTFPWLRSAGLPLNSSAGVFVNWNDSSVCALLTLHAGASGLRATLEQTSHHSSQTTGCSQVNCTEGIDTGHLLAVCSGQDQEDSLKVGIRASLYNSQRSAFSFDLQGHHDISSIGLMVNISHNISALHSYLPFEFHSKSQLSHASSSVKVTAELLVGVSGLAFEAEISSTNSGFKQVLMFNHSIPQLHLLPRNLALRTHYGGKRGSHTLTHRAQWENQDLTDSSDGVTQLQIYPELSGKTHGWGFALRVENDTQRKLGDLSVDWTLYGHHDQVRVQGSWTLVSGKTDSFEQKQPFISTLAHFQMQALSHGPDHRHDSNNQAPLSWEHGKPVNVSVTVSEHWHDGSSRGQACIFLSPGQIQSLLPLVEMEGCVAVAQEGKAYSQNTELKWKDKRIAQSMKYQGGVKGMHTLLVELGAQNVSPSPCPSHSLLTQIHTNLRDRLEHQVQIGLCPPQPWQVGNWSVELACSSLSSGRNVAVQVHAKLDHSEMLWLQGVLGKRCLRAAAGYNTEMSDEIRVAFCSEGHHWFTLEAQRGGCGIENETLTLISVGAANQSLLFQAKGCRECMWAAEARLQQLGSRIRSKLLDRVQRLQHLLLTLRRQAGDSMFLLELSEGPLSLTQQAETLLLQRAGALWKAWTTGLLRHTLTHSLPHMLHVLHLISQQVQQELRKPLATLAGAYHDVTGVRLDTAWQQGVQLWTRELTELLPAILHDPQLRAPSLTALHVAIFAMDMVGQQTFQWMEARSAAMLVGIRRQLALMYKFSKSVLDLGFSICLLMGMLVCVTLDISLCAGEPSILSRGMLRIFNQFRKSLSHPS
ncbi:uncharacterized protein [Sinocyclocheilus grahami]|uniref:uncharacterized protein n=1 Tax=Sinocyclocheilus grahami TaxID=75366 RepID=UPI0007ACD426|nr:PREDICTED: uncharacterized protein LOC107568620 [Sinocyclocheilus grahami]